MMFLLGMSHLTRAAEVMCFLIFQENIPLVFSILIHDSLMIV